MRVCVSSQGLKTINGQVLHTEIKVCECEHTRGIPLQFPPTKCLFLCVFLCVCVSKACKVQVGSSVMIWTGKLKCEGSQASDWLALPNVHQHSLLAEGKGGRSQGLKSRRKVERRGRGGHFPTRFILLLERGALGSLWGPNYKLTRNLLSCGVGRGQ